MKDERLISIVVSNRHGNMFRKQYLEKADVRDAIRWTLQSEDLPHYVPGQITKVEVFGPEEDDGYDKKED